MAQKFDFPLNPLAIRLRGTEAKFTQVHADCTQTVSYVVICQSRDNQFRVKEGHIRKKNFDE